LFFLLSFGQTASAQTDEEKFRRCVEIKDLTLSIAAAADRGTSREELKAKVNHRPSVTELIDLVYDFRGAMSNQEIAARQMNNCFKVSGIRPR
jgi:hypothetical protein